MDIEELLTHSWNYLWFDKICNRNKNSDKLLDKLVRDGILTNLNEKHKSEVSCILNNFIKVVKREDNTFYFNSKRTSFDIKTIINGEYVKNKCGYKQTMYVMNCLEDCGYISRERGYRYSKKKVKQGMVIISKPFERIILEFVDKTTQSNEKEES